MPQFRPLSETKFINDANLVSYWKLDGNSNDSKGSNNGTDTDISYSTSNVPYPNFIQGASFNGTSSKVEIADTASLEGFTALSCGGWIYPTENRDGCILMKRVNTDGSAPSAPYQLWGISLSSDGTIFFAISTGSAGSRKYVITSTHYTLNTWQHIFATYDGSTMKVYINGKQDVNTTSTNLTVGTNTLSIRIGHYINYNVSEQWFKGNIDDLSVFNRGLSSAEVNELYQGMTLGEYLPNSNTKLLLHLNGNSTDSSGNGNNGTDTNITYVDGKFGKCASGTIASQSGISIPYSASLVPGTGAFSRRFSIKTTITTLGYFYYSQENSSTHNQVDGAYMNTNGKVVTQFRGVENTITQITSNKSINDGVFHNIVVGSSGSGGTQYIYIDGKLDVSGAVGTTNINLQSPTPYTLMAANQAWGPGRNAYLECLMDEVIFENRMPTPQEVSKYNTMSKGRFGIL